MWAHEEGGQPEHKAIERGEIRRTLSGAIADQELMLEQERLSCDPAHAARAEEFREGNEQMDRQEEKIAHELKIITPANLHKTCTIAAIHAKIYQFATHRRRDRILFCRARAPRCPRGRSVADRIGLARPLTTNLDKKFV